MLLYVGSNSQSKKHRVCTHLEPTCRLWGIASIETFTSDISANDKEYNSAASAIARITSGGDHKNNVSGSMSVSAGSSTYVYKNSSKYRALVHDHEMPHNHISIYKRIAIVYM